MSQIGNSINRSNPEYIEHEIARGKAYYLVVLKLGPRERNDPGLVAELQSQHLRHIFALRETGKLMLNGPVLDDSSLRGICIYNSADLTEIEGYCENDPLVREGFLVAEIYPWMGLPGDCLG